MILIFIGVGYRKDGPLASYPLYHPKKLW